MPNGSELDRKAEWILWWILGKERDAHAHSPPDLPFPALQLFYLSLILSSLCLIEIALSSTRLCPHQSANLHSFRSKTYVRFLCKFIQTQIRRGSFVSQLSWPVNLRKRPACDAVWTVVYRRNKAPSFTVSESHYLFMKQLLWSKRCPFGFSTFPIVGNQLGIRRGQSQIKQYW